MEYSPGDKIFAKVKGHPHWPSRINLLPPDVTIPKGKYPIFFYGTHEVYFLASKDIFPYEKFKHKYAIPRNKALFQVGLREIEEDPDILFYGKDPQSEDFLSRFYKFTRNATKSQKQEQPGARTESASQPANNQTGKRASTRSPAECPLPTKRPHVETTPRWVSTNKKKTSPVVQTSPQSQKKRPRKAPVISKQDPAPLADVVSMNQSLTVQAESQTDSSSTRPKRLASLRLRIRNDGNGLKFSPAHESPSSLSPSTSGSNGTVEAKRPVEAISTSSITNTPDPLRITIKQLSTSPSIVVATTVTSNSNLVSSRPVFSVAPSSSTGLLGVGSDSNVNQQRNKSTAVVIPLRRSNAPPPPGLSDDSAAESTPNTEVGTPSLRTSPVQRVTSTLKHGSSLRRNAHVKNVKHSRGNYKGNRHRKDTAKVSGSVAAMTTPLSEHDSASTQFPWRSNECEKKSEVTSGRLGGGPVLSSKITSHKSVLPHVDRSSGEGTQLKELTGIGKEKKEQQLKDLDTEARLLLIDRSIKSSLVRDHEDITTCVDRLAVLDRMTISLPVLAKCWTVVETIRKCRRYKRSLEVKIAAQKVFNKFLQLYATADKHELDLAHAELVRHQQRYVKQHSTQRASSEQSTVIPPYTGPKSMSELFQVSLSERRQTLSDTKSTHLMITDSTVQSVKSGDHDNFDSGKDLTSSESVCNPGDHCRSKSTSEFLPVEFSISDIPLPEDSPSESRTRLSNSCFEPFEAPPAAENGEEEFEVLDEYEEAGEVKNASSSNAPSSLACPAQPVVSTSSVSDYLSVPFVAYSMMQPQFIPAPSFSTVPTVTPDTNPVSPSTSMGGFVNSSAVIPHYSTSYVIPYGYGCLPGSSFNQAVQTPLRSAQYTPLANAAVCCAAGSSSFSVPVEVTPPQSASRAYVPHALHPTTDPLPPYRPYIPSQTETDQIIIDPSTVLSPRTSRVIRSDGSSTRHSGSSSRRALTLPPSPPVHRSTTVRPEPERHSCSSRSNSDRHFRSPPHRARSPHALPHPLEHYQRCLVTALSSDEDRSGCPSERVWCDDPMLKQVSHTANANTDNLLTRPASEDLDARIARLIGQAARTHTPKSINTGKPSDTRKYNNPLVSPPPPPPPPPTSQRILFTHRPPANQLTSTRSLYHKSNRSASKFTHRPFSNDQCRMPSAATRRGIPPHTPDSPPFRRMADVDNRLNAPAPDSADRNELNLIGALRTPLGSRPSDDSALSTCTYLSVAHTLPKAYSDRPADSVRVSEGSKILNEGRNIPVAPVHPDSSDSASRPSHDEDREIYSMLGV